MTSAAKKILEEALALSEQERGEAKLLDAEEHLAGMRRPCSSSENDTVRPRESRF